jgi:ATP-dependent helicase/nuclease subunit B
LEREIEQVSEDRQERYRKKLKDLFWTKEVITQIFHELPQENFDYTILPKQIARGLINIVTNYSKIDEENNLDEEAIKKIKERLTILIESEYPLSDMPVNESLTLMTDLIKNERVNCSEPRGGWMPRKKILVALILTKKKAKKANTRCCNYSLLLKAKLFFPIPVLILRTIEN